MPAFVSARTGVAVSMASTRDHLLGVVGVELQLRDLADADAVEQYRRALQQPRHGVLKLHAVGRALPKPTGIVQPVDKRERLPEWPPA